MPLIIDPDLLARNVEVDFNTDTKTIDLNIAGDLNAADGVTLQCLYSFAKEEWKSDATLIPYPFPFVAITPEQFELVNDWEFTNDTMRSYVRTGGWSEIDTVNGNLLKRQYTCVVTLGSFETPGTDTAYFQIGTDPTVDTTTPYSYAGPVNQAVQVYTDYDAPAGLTFASTSTITMTTVPADFVVGGQVTVMNSTSNDGTYVLTAVDGTTLTVAGTPLTVEAVGTTTIAADNRNAIKNFLRIRNGSGNGTTFSQATMADIGATTVDNKVFRFPLANATDLKITTLDSGLATGPWDQIVIKYFNQAYVRTGLVVSPLNFGIVIDVGTHSGVDGAYSSGGSVLTSATGGIPTDATYTGGSITIWEGSAPGTTYTISGTPTATTVTITGTFPAETATNYSFTIQRTSPVTATAEQIYEKVQYLLRQGSNINDTGITGEEVFGDTADALLRFVGDTLIAGSVTAPPSNPHAAAGIDGVFIEGFDSNDTNRLKFVNNSADTEAEQTFPFVAAGTINFNDNLVNDGGPAEYWMFFTHTGQTSVASFSISGATGSTASLNSTAEFPTLTQNDYINIQGMANPENNGIWQVTDATPTTSQFDATKVDGATVVNETLACTLDVNPINSPDAIIVQNNSVANIEGTIGASSVGFDFDYDGNVQGGRTQATNAAVTLRAIGHNTAQFVEATGTITRATGLTFSLVAGLERNYVNPV